MLQAVQTRKFRMKSKKSTLTYKLQCSGRSRSTTQMLLSPLNSTQEETVCDEEFLLTLAGKQTMHAHYF